MKVLHVIPSVGPVRGGPSEAVLAMCRALRARGVEADIVTTNDNGPDLLPVSTGQFQDFDGNRICFLPRWSPSVPALREFQYSQEFAHWLRSHMQNYDGLHVHAVFSYLSTCAMSLARSLRKPFIVRPLGQFDEWSLRQKAWKKRLYYALIEKANVTAAAAFHCTSSAEARNVVAHVGKARTAIIPHGIEAMSEIADASKRVRDKFEIRLDEKIILFLSRWAEKKNIPLLLEALAKMQDDRWTLILAGTGDTGYQKVIREKITCLGLAQRVRCPGHVSGDTKTMLLQGSDMFVLPSISENFGVAAAEALCCGLPTVVSSGVDIADTILKLNGGSVCVTTAESIASAIRSQLQGTLDRKALKLAARQQFSWTRAAIQLETLYGQVFV